tara:strand:- start:5655 stop:6299 length:645 start_codon:yes stop_codon:yes gene_type:complete
MNISLKLLDNDKAIQAKILDALAQQLKGGFTKAAARIKKQLQIMVKDAIESQPEYNSLLSGQLKDELGIPNPTTRVNAIVDTWSNNVEVVTKPVAVAGSQIKGGLSIGMIKEDYGDVLGMDEASIEDRQTGSVIPWLYWLLLGGGGILVKDYAIKIGPSKRSRTGNAIMIKSVKNWRMPSQFVGVADNNWVYRAISQLDSKIETMMQSELERSL